MVPGGLDGERQLLRTGLRQGASRYPQEELVSGRLARERQLLHPLKVRILAPPGFSSDCKTARSQPVAPHRMITATHGRQFWQRRTNVWRKATNPARAAKRPRSVRVVFRYWRREMTKEEQVVGLIFEVTMWAYIAAAAYVVIG